MTGVSEEHLYGLIEIAERQQSVAQMVLEGLAKERVSLGSELENWTGQIAQLQEDIRSAVANAISEALMSAEDTGAAAVAGATDTLRTNMDNVEAQIVQVEAILRGWVRWLSWRVVTLGLASVAMLSGLWWLASCALLWWDASAIGRAQAQKAQLMVEVAQLQANRDAWAATGMTSKLTRCGPEKRPCIRVDDKAGAFGDRGDYRIIWK